MNPKQQLYIECCEVLKKPDVSDWYEKNLESKPQAETIKSLLLAIFSGELTIEEALKICLIIGIQWNVKFEGVP